MTSKERPRWENPASEVMAWLDASKRTPCIALAWSSVDGWHDEAEFALETVASPGSVAQRVLLAHLGEERFASILETLRTDSQRAGEEPTKERRTWSRTIGHGFCSGDSDEVMWVFVSTEGVGGGGYWHSYGDRSDEHSWLVSWADFLQSSSVHRGALGPALLERVDVYVRLCMGTERSDSVVEAWLAREGNVVLAWDLNLAPVAAGLAAMRELSVFTLMPGAKCVAVEAWPDAEIEAVTRRYAARGVWVGHHDGHLPVVWRATPEAVEAWDDDGLAMRARGGLIVDCGGHAHRVEEVQAIVGYVESGYIARGLKVELISGALKTLIYTFSMHASDPTYNRNDLLSDTAWIHALGSMLAKWAGKPYRSTF